MNKKEKRAQLIAEMRAINETLIAEKRDFTEDEKKSYSEKEAEVRKLSAEIAAEERENELKGFVSELPAQANPDQRSAGNDEMAEFRSFLLTGNKEKRTALTTTDNGVIAPEKFVKDVIEILEKEATFYGMVDKIPVTGAGSLGIPYEEVDASDADWTDEVPEAEITADSSYKFGKRELVPTDLTKLVKISKKLLKGSAIAIDQLIRNKLVSKVLAAFESGILNGTGTKQPLGVFTASADGVPTSRDVSTAGAAIVADDLIKTKMNLRPGYRKNAEWAISTDILLDIMLLKDNDGQYIWKPGLRDGDPDKLLGLPVHESEYAPSAKTAGSYVAVLGNFRKYYKFATWEGFDIQVLNEKFATKNQVGFLVHTLADGQPANAEAFSRLKIKSNG